VALQSCVKGLFRGPVDSLPRLSACATGVGCKVTTARIRLIDDDVDMLDMLKIYLEREEFAVTAIDAAAMGVAAALSSDHDLAVLDVMMPHMSGIEALRRIRLLSLMAVLMLTAKGDDADRIVGLELGADDYVAKPCTRRSSLRASAQSSDALEPSGKTKTQPR
jgi:CheY-like chemotaxis protein